MSELERIAEQIASKSLPPVATWNPAHQGDIDIEIDANGNWFHQGDAFTRIALVKLFASILDFDGTRYSLVTPAERWYVQVEDVPFVITQAELIERTWVTTNNLGEQAIVGISHPIKLQRYNGVWVPYQTVRANLRARVNRSVFTQWVDQALSLVSTSASTALPDASTLYLSSGDYQFPVAR